MNSRAGSGYDSCVFSTLLVKPFGKGSFARLSFKGGSQLVITSAYALPWGVRCIWQSSLVLCFEEGEPIPLLIAWLSACQRR